MGIVPLQYKAGDSRQGLWVWLQQRLGSKGSIPPWGESCYCRKLRTYPPQQLGGHGDCAFAVQSWRHCRDPRFDSDLELLYHAHGGILNYMVRKLVKQTTG